MDRSGLNPARVASLEGTRFGDVRVLATVDSTSRLLLDEARSAQAPVGREAPEGRKAPEGLVVVADHQSAGRGRRDRTWTAPPGSALLVSVLLRPALPVEHRHLLMVAAGLAATEAVSDVVGVRPGLKWPNDLVAGDPERKLAGILADVGAGDAVVLGMGMNLRGAALAPEVRDIAIAVDELGGAAGSVAVDRDEVLVAWLVRLESRLALLERPDGAAEILTAYRDACVTLGRDVRVEVAGSGEVLVGRAVSVADDGRLVVERGDGPRVPISAGDVVHVR